MPLRKPIAVGKKSASGTILSTTKLIAPIAMNGIQSSTYRYELTVTGLKFKPSLIRVFYSTGPTGNTDTSTFQYHTALPYWSMNHYASYRNDADSNSNTFGYRGDQYPLSITDTGFTIAVNEQNRTYVWVAYE